MINSYIPMEEIKDDLKKFSKEDLEQAMKKVDEDFVYTSNKETYIKLKNKLESIRVSGDRGELWNFEAGFLLGILEGAEMNKKIAEKLGEFVGFRTTGCPYIPKKPCHNNIDYGKSCKECIIDWARKEVEKNG